MLFYILSSFANYTDSQSITSWHRFYSLAQNRINRYWRPIYCYLRRKGYREARAKELTQDFFCEIVLGRELIQHADQTKGRFRKLLLTALERYLVSIRCKEGRQKRQPRTETVNE